ncbi:MAG: tetratricopeptide repeat protein [Paracoccaceae bacterium]
MNWFARCVAKLMSRTKGPGQRQSWPAPPENRPTLAVVAGGKPDQARDRPPGLGHLARSEGDFSSYGRAQQSANAMRLGHNAEQAGRMEEAAEHYYQSAKLWPEHGNTQKAAEAFLAAGHLEQALRIAQNQLERCRRETGHQTDATANAFCYLAQVQLACGMHKEAELGARAALRIDRSTKRINTADHWQHLAMLAEVMLATGAYAEAAESLDMAAELATKHLGKKHAETSRVKGLIADLRVAQARP